MSGPSLWKEKHCGVHKANKTLAGEFFYGLTANRVMARRSVKCRSVHRFDRCRRDALVLLQEKADVTRASTRTKYAVDD